MNQKYFLFICVVFTILGSVLLQGLNSNVYIEKQLLCALDKAPCDNLGKQIKGFLPEVIGKNCKSCDNKQFANAKRITRFVQNKYPAVWNELVRKYGDNQEN
ncbi:uncharacterized protein LOC126750131 [Anthonomus grandis grandis]|uniref:uncharacterized protein LOC126750131 n=1 Tax=Anthonomus grandis grandis TaxID=2921223 RepID=UPI00216571DB|nr:uncharacterized protein LOC126750131 [Anthonomus grandis grandis]